MKNLLIYLLPLMFGRRNQRTNYPSIQDTHSKNQLPKEELIQVIVSGTANDEEERYIQSVGSVKYKLPMINSYVVEIPRSKIGQLRKIKGVRKVEQDTHITAQMNVARESINTNWATENGITGRGIGVAIVDTGIFPHKDFVGRRNRILAFKDFVNQYTDPYDDNGHGTHVAGIVGGDGYSSAGKYMGIAPDCHFVGVKVLDDNGAGNISDVLAGLQWVIDNKDRYNIKVVNVSVGTEDKEREGENSALVRGVNAAWDAGLVVVVAAGNNGPQRMSITTPGISRKIITVGSSDDKESVDIFGDYITDYSGRGPTKACIKKPDVVAPGSNIVSCDTDKAYRPAEKIRNDIGYTSKSGTSMATPIISGAVALLLSRHRAISNKDVKMRLKNASFDIGLIQEHQGWGLMDIKKFLTYKED